MKILIIDNHTKNLDFIKGIFPTDSLVITKEDFDKGFSIEEYEILVLTGGSGIPGVLNHPEVYEKEIDLIRNSNKSILGICLGCEIINHALGGELQELQSDHWGEVDIAISDPELGNFINGKALRAYEHHRVGIKRLAANFRVCATSNHGPEIIECLRAPIIGIQFHPEVESHQGLFNWIFSVLAKK